MGLLSYEGGTYEDKFLGLSDKPSYKPSQLSCLCDMCYEGFPRGQARRQDLSSCQKVLFPSRDGKHVQTLSKVLCEMCLIGGKNMVKIFMDKFYI